MQMRVFFFLFCVQLHTLFCYYCFVFSLLFLFFFLSMLLKVAYFYSVFLILFSSYFFIFSFFSMGAPQTQAWAYRSLPLPYHHVSPCSKSKLAIKPTFIHSFSVIALISCCKLHLCEESKRCTNTFHGSLPSCPPVNIINIIYDFLTIKTCLHGGIFSACAPCRRIVVRRIDRNRSAQKRCWCNCRCLSFVLVGYCPVGYCPASVAPIPRACALPTVALLVNSTRRSWAHIIIVEEK